MLRRLRAVLITALAWALVWAPVGVVVGFVHRESPDLVGIIPAVHNDVLATTLRYAVDWGLLGAINGALFAGLMAVAERGRSLASLSMSRIALWGAIATIILPTIVFFILLFTIPFGNTSVELLPLLSILILGAACGLTMILVARRGAPRLADPEPGSLTRA